MSDISREEKKDNTDRYYGGITPVEYLKQNEWELDERSALWDVSRGFLHGEVWRDPIYEGKHTIEKALVRQLLRDVERVGGFESFMKLINEQGVSIDALDW